MKSNQLRVLQIIPNLGTGGAEKLLVDSIPKYIEKGIHMDILVLNGTRYPFYNELEKSGIKIYSLGLGSVYNPLLIFKIIRYLSKYGIAHVHLFPALYWVALAKIISFSKIKLIFTEHCTSNKRMNKSFWRCLDRFIYDRYSRIISITKEVDLILRKHLKIENNDQNFDIVHNGIDLSKFSGKICYAEKTTLEKTIIQVSSFRKQKDQATLIRALSILPTYIKLILVGDGENKMYCELLAKDIDVTDRVHFLGVRTDIYELLTSSDIIVLSSFYEGLSLSSIEGMISGKPFLASDVPGLRDIVNGAGILFTPGDEKQLANKILNLINDKELYIKTAEACQERAKKYDINIMVDEYIKIYKELTN